MFGWEEKRGEGEGWRETTSPRAHKFASFLLWKDATSPSSFIGKKSILPFKIINNKY